MENGSIVWVRSLLAVYRQAAADAASEGVDPAARVQLIEELGRAHGLFTAHEGLVTLWHEGFGGSEAGVRSAFAPLVAGALACNPETPMRALVEFAAEEMSVLFESE